MIDFVDIGTLLFCDSLMFLRPDKAMDGNSSIIVFFTGKLWCVSQTSLQNNAHCPHPRCVIQNPLDKPSVLKIVCKTL
jgi:hypothetical protein